MAEMAEQSSRSHALLGSVVAAEPSIHFHAEGKGSESSHTRGCPSGLL